MSNNYKISKILKYSKVWFVFPSLILTICLFLVIQTPQETSDALLNFKSFGEFISKPITFVFCSMFYVMFLLLGELIKGSQSKVKNKEKAIEKNR